tara:strand:+ start:7471 stop:8631 length:1161 start_codon:yes stop_codon:yes gene_type:complete
VNLEDYFSPLPDSFAIKKEVWQSSQIGSLISIHCENYFPDTSNCKIAIFSVPEFEGSQNSESETKCQIREEFFELHNFDFPNLADLGIMKISSSRKQTFSEIEKICKELIKIDVLPIIIGGGNDISYAVYKSYASLNKFITFTSIDSKFDLGLKKDYLSSGSYLSKIISHSPSFLFQFVNIGYQTYYNSPLAISMLNDMNFESIRLGTIQEALETAEPILRNTDFLSFDISAISSAFASANKYSNPNGLNGPEACKLAFYAGISDKLSSFGLFEYNQNLDNTKLTAKLLSQIIWYFVQGYSKRRNELVPNIKNCIKYNVSLDNGKNEIIFYKSKLSARWWMGVPFFNKDNSKKETYFVACSYSDYEISLTGEVPDRWIRTYYKLTS